MLPTSNHLKMLVSLTLYFLYFKQIVQTLIRGVWYGYALFANVLVQVLQTTFFNTAL